GPLEDRLVVVDRVRARPRLRREQPQRIAAGVGGPDPPPGRGGGARGRGGGGVPARPPPQYRPSLPGGVGGGGRGGAGFSRERDGIVRDGKAREAPGAERLEVIDRVARQLTQPLLLALVAVIVDAEPPRQLRADVEVVAALRDRRDRLLHIDDVVAGARPGRVHVVALPERRRRQHDI